MMLTRRPVRLAGMVRCQALFVMLSVFAGSLALGALGAPIAAAGEAIRVSMNTSYMLKLDRDASVVLIANPTIADVAVENARLIFIFGIEPGETNLHILDADNNEILLSPVVVVPLVERQVTINRANVNEEASYSCAPRCAAVATPTGTGSLAQNTGSSASAGSGEAAAGAASGATAATADAPATETTDTGG